MPNLYRMMNRGECRIVSHINSTVAEKFFQRVIASRNQEEMADRYEDIGRLFGRRAGISIYDDEQLKRIDNSWEEKSQAN